MPFPAMLVVNLVYDLRLSLKPRAQRELGSKLI